MANKNSPLYRIRKHCLDCVGERYRAVEECTATDCALHPFRMGKNPFRTKREMTEEQKAAVAERLRKGRENKGSGESGKSL